jgi:hypothetical protein
MDQALLVSIDIPLGREVISALEAAGLTVNVALWAWLSEYEDWRLVLASRTLDKEGLRRRYGLVNQATDAAGIAFHRAPEILILKTTDPFIRELRRVFAKSKNVEGMRLGGQRFGDRSIGDAWVYRIA